METDIRAGIARIEQATHDNAAAVQAQGELLRTAIARLDQIVELLSPKDVDGGVSLDELLAHLIKQMGEQLELIRSLVQAVARIEEKQPDAVAEKVAELVRSGRGSRA